MQNMSSVQMPSSITPLGDDIPLEDESLSRRIQDYCLRMKDHRRYKKDTHQVTMSSIRRVQGQTTMAKESKIKR